MDEIHKKVTRILTRHLNIPEQDIVPEARLVELGMDSLDLLDIVFDLEEEFQIEIDNLESVGLETVEDAVKKVEHLTTRASTSPPKSGTIG